jgi:Spy/CpxP family protein refolding chaperone
MRMPLDGLLPYLDLDLSESQKEQVRAMLNDARTSLGPLAAEVGRARRALFAAVTSPTYDEAAVRAAADAVGRAAGAVAVERARLQAQIRAILTAEQQAKLDEAFRRMGERLDRRGRGPQRGWHGRMAPATHVL